MIHYSQFNLDKIKPVKVKYKKEYFDDNIYCFDIETTSMYINGEEFIYPSEDKKRKDSEIPISICWIWSTCINGYTLFGRTLEEFKSFVVRLYKHLGARPIIYIHNASFEFVFLSNVFKWTKIFARAPHRLIYYDCAYAQFRCSYMLTRLSLENWAIQTGGVQKLVGDLDYTKVRTPNSVVTQKEMSYSENDVLSMYGGLKVYKKRYTHMCNIPLTQTGEVRRKIKDMFKDDTKHLFNMTRLLPEDGEMYSIYKALVWGGITHANIFFVDKLLKNVKSYDITSSYPYVMCARRYPVAPPIKITNTRWKEYLDNKNYCSFYKVRFTELRSKLHNHYLSAYKHISIVKPITDNGRIIECTEIYLWLTDVDLSETLDSYNYDEFEVLETYICRADYLPKKLIEFILGLFENKTKLDGVKGYEDIYLQSKQFINSIFGMMLTDIVQEDVIYDNGKWFVNKSDINNILQKKKKEWYNNFNSYLQGIWIVAYARQNLWSGIKAIDRDVVYYDTDSIKFIGNHEEWFIEYNKRAFSKLENTLLHYDIDVSRATPVNPKGKVKTLGEFKYEGTYKKFKTLGAKRYCYEDGEGIHLTTSGVNKKHGANALKSVNDFTNNLIFDHEYCKRFQLHYNNEQPCVVWNKDRYDEFKSEYKYGVCFTPSKYKMKDTFENDLKELIGICLRGIY